MCPLIVCMPEDRRILDPDDVLLFHDTCHNHRVLEVAARTRCVPDVEGGIVRRAAHIVAECWDEKPRHQIVMRLVVVRDHIELAALRLVADAIRWVCVYELCLAPVHQSLNRRRICCATADEAMIPEVPKVAELGKWLVVIVCALLCICIVIDGIIRALHRGDDLLQVFLRESGQLHWYDSRVHLLHHIHQLTHIEISKLRDAVVCDKVGVLLLLARIVLVLHGCGLPSHRCSCHPASVPFRNEPAALADGDRCAPARRLDDVAEQSNLLFIMIVRVPGVRSDISECDDLIIRTEHGHSIIRHTARLCW